MTIKIPRKNCIYEIEPIHSWNRKVFLKYFAKVDNEMICKVWVVPAEPTKINTVYTAFQPKIHKIIRKVNKGEHGKE